MNLSLLIHTFDEYKKFWPGCWDSWHKHMNQYLPKYFGSDIVHNVEGDAYKYIYSGRGEWSDRLLNILDQIPTEYVLYCQEDHWPTSEPPNFSEMMKIVSEKKLLRLQLSPIVQFYSLTGSEIPLFFHPSSKYLVSHQPSIWNKKFLISCLEVSEDPWQNEYKGSLRLLNDPNIKEKIAIYPCNWFKHVGIKGELRP